MLRIFADNPDDAFALNDFALLAHRLYGRSYFHDAHSFPRLLQQKLLSLGRGTFPVYHSVEIL